MAATGGARLWPRHHNEDSFEDSFEQRAASDETSKSSTHLEAEVIEDLLRRGGYDEDRITVTVSRLAEYAARGQQPNSTWAAWAIGIARKLSRDELATSLATAQKLDQVRRRNEAIDACGFCDSSGLRWNHELDEAEYCDHQPSEVAWA